MNGAVIDFHTHAFADGLAARALASLSQEGNLRPVGDGTAAGLVASMDACGIGLSVVCPIATRPGQFAGICAWSAGLAAASGGRLLGLASIHPRDPEALARVDDVAAMGFRGVKLHPFYQDFFVDEAELFPFYRRLAERGLFVVFHNGYDIGFVADRRAGAERMARVLDAVPGLTVVMTHFGGWLDWMEARRVLAGREVYIETSFSVTEMSREELRALVEAHRPDRLLFGTDWPWKSPAEDLAVWREVCADRPDVLQAVLHDNAARLLGLGE